jgi:hypothetical protein
MRYSIETLGVLLALSLSACGPASLTFRNPQSPNNNAAGSPGSPVCQPGTTATATGGLSGNLYYLNPGSTPLSTVDAYIQTGIKAPNEFFFNYLDVPTEPFTLGFVEANGALLSAINGTVLTENFALDLRSQVVLGNMPSGDYEFGIISDDGSTLAGVDSTGKETTLVNNDGVHQSRFACATQVVHFDSTTDLNIHLKYYQGPRDYIALILMWKKIATGQTIDTANCGDSGNTLFFDPTTSPPAPQTEYKGLLARGWAPLQSDNYVLPAGVTNACAI